MGAVTSVLTDGVSKLLMPADGSYTKDWYGFGPATPNSLLVVGHVRLEVADLGLAGRFFTEALGAAPPKSPGGDVEGEICFPAGASTFVLGAAAEAKAWPGQFYVWVADIQAARTACGVLQTELSQLVVLQELCLKREDRVDVLVLREPSTGHVFMVNQAPKGYDKMLAAAGFLEEAGDRPNLLTLMDVQVNIPPSASAGLTAFYRIFLGASGRRAEGGCKVDFSAGESIRQALTFKEEDDDTEESKLGEATAGSLCLYVPSHDKFTQAYNKCLKADIVTSPPSSEAQGDLMEFRFRRCIVPASGDLLLNLEHIIRSPLHSECPIPNEVAASEALRGA
mmetsp:Transcript_159362/g.511278  ORF Transcript_159362/g.511278 Transcript_159362/m.511278 type:complete len:338 (+) Transcript_159362:74-1087(+)